MDFSNVSAPGTVGEDDREEDCEEDREEDDEDDDSRDRGEDGGRGVSGRPSSGDSSLETVTTTGDAAAANCCDRSCNPEVFVVDCIDYARLTINTSIPHLE